MSSLYSKTIRLSIFIPLIILVLSCNNQVTGKRLFNDNWKYLRVDTIHSQSEAFYYAVDFNDNRWEDVSLPHTAKLENLICNDQWQGTCWYRKKIRIPKSYAGKKIILEFEAAMGTSEFWVNGVEVAEHQGGYLPVVMDITEYVKIGKTNVVAVQLNNKDNPYTGPKALKQLDFCMYGGLYRNAWLYAKNKVHISHPALSNAIAGGGVFISTPKVDQKESVIEVKTELSNSKDNSVQIQIIQQLLFNTEIIETKHLDNITILPGENKCLVSSFSVNNAKLWSPSDPHLYKLSTQVLVNGILSDTDTTRFGIRKFEFTNNDLYINGKKTFLRGVNRHQEYPFVGYALSDRAQYRDAEKIKDAGFSMVRLSHYPQSTAFLDACDELGLVVIDAILGWQYYLDDDRFRNYCYHSARQLVRRDRNHPSVLAWGVRQNSLFMQHSYS